MPRWLLFSLPLVAFLILAVIFYRALDNNPQLLPSARLDKPFPAFSLTSLDDAQQTLSEQDLKGPALVNVWATWCPSCIVEHPFLVELAGHGIPVIGLNYKDVRQAAKQYLAIHGNPYRLVIYDDQGDLGFDLGVYGAPETYLVDGQGIIRHRHVGVLDQQVWVTDFWPLWQSISGFIPEGDAQ